MPQDCGPGSTIAIAIPVTPKENKRKKDPQGSTLIWGFAKSGDPFEMGPSNEGGSITSGGTYETA